MTYIFFFSCFKFTKTVWGLNRPECLRCLAYYSTAQLTLESSQPLTECLSFWAKLGMQAKDWEHFPWAPFILLLFLFFNVFLIASIYTWGIFVSIHSNCLEVCNIHKGISLLCLVLIPIPNTHLHTHAHSPRESCVENLLCILSDFSFLSNHEEFPLHYFFYILNDRMKCYYFTYGGYKDQSERRTFSSR